VWNTREKRESTNFLAYVLSAIVGNDKNAYISFKVVCDKYELKFSFNIYWFNTNARYHALD